MALLDCNDDKDEDYLNVDAYINTGACNNNLYMPAMDEEAFRTHDDQPVRPTTCTQRLVFRGLSQEDMPPEAGDPAAQDKPGNIFGPTMLHKTVGEQ